MALKAVYECDIYVCFVFVVCCCLWTISMLNAYSVHSRSLNFRMFSDLSVLCSLHTNRFLYSKPIIRQFTSWNIQNTHFNNLKCKNCTVLQCSYHKECREVLRNIWCCCFELFVQLMAKFATKNQNSNEYISRATHRDHGE